MEARRPFAGQQGWELGDLYCEKSVVALVGDNCECVADGCSNFLLNVAVTSQLGLQFQKTEFWFGVSKLATLGGPLRGRIVFQYRFAVICLGKK